MIWFAKISILLLLPLGAQAFQSEDQEYLPFTYLPLSRTELKNSEDVVLTVQTRQGKQVFSKPVSWYVSFAVVLDSREGRRIISLSAGEAAVKVALDEIIEQGYEVSLYGERRVDSSSPEILWARSK